MADSTLQITPGAGGVYARVLQGPTVDGYDVSGPVKSY
jgi:hypothetical protein